MKVRQAMHAGVDWCAPETRLSDIAKIMRDADVGAVPIGEDDRLIGMVTDRDIVCRGFADGKDPASLTARDVMTQGIVYCTEDQSMEDAIHLMEKRRIRRMPVLNGKKRMTGMLSLGDVSHAADHESTGELAEAVSAHH
jgi:CBS domain-containing protein